ncbi:hypothetical protein K501DRAFT_268517 [Backusella circina FSU 941]|nr:hypothetical protein K501DRAFT_268517 [Backusella circina FSU 941]
MNNDKYTSLLLVKAVPCISKYNKTPFNVNVFYLSQNENSFVILIKVQDQSLTKGFPLMKVYYFEQKNKKKPRRVYYSTKRMKQKKKYVYQRREFIDRLCSRERKHVRVENRHIVVLIGDRGYVIGSRMKGHLRYGGV